MPATAPVTDVTAPLLISISAPVPELATVEPDTTMPSAPAVN